MQLHVDPHARTPVYRQIERQIAEAIADRRLRPGEALLPETEMAARLVVSPTSVRKAYEQLEDGGLCRTGDDHEMRVLASAPGERLDGRAGRALALLKRELLAEELESARRTQVRLLPPSRLETGPWVAEARTCPAGTLSGDFHDLMRLPEGGLGVVVADVVGKGLAAGLLMAVARSMLPFLTPHHAPAEVLGELNRRLCPLLGRREFVALTHARLSADGEWLEWANAGLPDPYLVRGGGVTTLPTPGPRLPLGLRPDLAYRAARHRLEPGDRLLFTTDGLAEARRGDGEPLGYDALAKLVEQATRRDDDGPGPWLEELVGRVRALTGPLPEDDWTALAVDHRGRRS